VVLALANALVAAIQMATTTLCNKEGSGCCQGAQQARRSSWQRIVRKAKRGGHADCDDHLGCRMIIAFHI